ncbi:condensation domain-containing protein [Streptomyces sp. NPDC048442]|uniref:condensation domain-containing protein n=1 Tax=Streptomyces sp. NPDC048442 TaxID=3154823 RepID=UPI003441485A
MTMTADHTPHTPGEGPGRSLTVVVDLTDKAEGALPVMELHGSLDTHRLESALDRVERAVHRPVREPLWHHRVERSGPRRHTLRFSTAADSATDPAADAGADPAVDPAGDPAVDPAGDPAVDPGAGPAADSEVDPVAEPAEDPAEESAEDPAADPGAPADFPAGLLADLLTHPPSAAPDGRRLQPTPLQRELVAHPSTARHSEQFAFAWTGPIDFRRFTAAWQSVFDRESMLRATFEDGPEPRLVQHDRIIPEVVLLSYATTDWNTVVEADRRRGLDPRGRGPLRITVLSGGPVGAAAEPTRVLLTFHHALLDGRSVRILLQEFYRAYLADGRLPGGERRPDLGDYLRWLGDRNTAPAQEFWAGADLDPGTDPLATATGAGVGYARTRLTVAQTEQLSTWAAGLGSPESSVLHAVWALLLYRARGCEGRARVRFHTTVSGRGIPFEGVEGLPAPLRNPLPVTVDVDPHATVPAFLGALRDQALERSAYEWVSAGQIRSWSGLRSASATGSLLVFEDLPRETEALTRLLAEQGVRVGGAETLGARTAFPFTLVAHHHDDGALALTASYDRSRLGDAGQLLSHTAQLLCRIPSEADCSTTVGELVELVAGLPQEPRPEPPRAVARPYSEDATAPPLVVLRPATSSGAGTVCLVQTPSTPRSLHTPLVRAYRGPEAIALLRPAEVSRLRDAVLRVLSEGPVVLGGFSGAGVVGYEVARAVAAFGARAPQLVLTSAATPVADFARTLQDTARRAR